MTLQRLYPAIFNMTTPTTRPDLTKQPPTARMCGMCEHQYTGGRICPNCDSDETAPLEEQLAHIARGYCTPDLDLRRTIDRIISANPTTRDETARIIQGEGFDYYKGGRHVAIIHGQERLAIITHPTAPDFN